MLVNTVKARTTRFLDRHFSSEAIQWPAIAAMFLPVLVDQAFVVCMSFINSAMVSSSGVAAIGAVSMVDSLNIFLISTFIAVSTGGTVVVAQYKGGGAEAMAPKAAAGSVAGVTLLALALGVLGVSLHGPLLSALFGGAAPDVFHNARIYFIGSCISYGGIAAEEAVCGALRGVGRTKSTLMLSLIMNFSCMAGNFVLINLLHMGVLGLAISVCFSRYFAAGCALWVLTRADTPVRCNIKDLLRLNFPMIRRILSVGIPFSAEQMFFNGGKLLTQTFIVGMGTAALAVNGICSSMAGILMIPANALIVVVVTVTGQCVGHGDIPGARKFIRSFLFLSSAFTLVMGLMLMPLFRPILSLYNPPAEIVPTITKMMLIYFISLVPLWAMSFMAPSALRAAGDAVFTSVAAMLSMWLVRVVLGYVIGVTLGLGIFGVWLAMEIEWGVRDVVFMVRLRGDKWYKRKLIE